MTAPNNCQLETLYLIALCGPQVQAAARGRKSPQRDHGLLPPVQGWGRLGERAVLGPLEGPGADASASGVREALGKPRGGIIRPQPGGLEAGCSPD
jgi:hypothetical protein